MAMAMSHRHLKEGVMKARKVAAGEFKNACLKLLDEVWKHGIPITVTKRGRPIARVVPVPAETESESLIGTVVYEADDIFSTGESFEAEG
jgi:prevent-host-death family protein